MRDRQARDPADKDLIFLTVTRRPYVREHANGEGGGGNIDTVALEFGKVLNALGIKWKGVNFGALRHTHVTAVGDHHDRNAARRVRGHKLEGIEAYYDKLTPARLKSVTEHARRRLLPSVPAVPALTADRPDGTRLPEPPHTPVHQPGA